MTDKSRVKFISDQWLFPKISFNALFTARESLRVYFGQVEISLTAAQIILWLENTGRVSSIDRRKLSNVF